MLHLQDVRYALRLLARTPGFTLLTVLVLAGGLGLSVFTFAFLHTAMLKPLPVSEGERLFRVLPRFGGTTGGIFDALDFAALRAARSVTEVGAFTDRELVVGSGEATRTIDATAAEWSIFRATGTRPMLGRGFVAEDQLPGAAPVVVLGEATWRAVFAGDSTIVGRVVPLSGVATRVVGVMPRGFGFPVAAEAWIPIPPALLAPEAPEAGRVMGWARLAPGYTVEQARTELGALLARARSGRPAPAPGVAAPTGVDLQTFPLAQIGDDAPLVLAVLNLLAMLILLLACINVTNLLLARANERARETAVRLALGAPRGRLVMQSLWEILLLCGTGGLLATGVAVWLLNAVNSWARTRLEGNLAFWWVWGFDRTVVVAAAAFVTLAVVVLGVVASRRAVNTQIGAVLQEGGVRSGGRREGRVARALVVAQVATVSLLLFFGSLSAIVAWRVVHLDLGYDTRNLLGTRLEAGEGKYADARARHRFYQALYDQLARRPEVAGVVLQAGLAGIGEARGAYTLGGEAAGGLARRTYVQGLLGPLATLGPALREGRLFDSRDADGSAPVALVSRAFAAQAWPGRSPVGAALQLPGLEPGAAPRTVVGVVDDLLLGNPFSRDRSAVAVYLPLAQVEAGQVSVAFRHRGSEPAGRAAFHETLQALDPTMPVPVVQNYDEILARTGAIARSVTLLFGGAFGFALLLAMSGTYGLMSRAIGRRTREIGVRRALGATDGTITRLLLGQGVRQLGIGAALALPLTLAVGILFARYFPLGVGVTVAAAVGVTGFVTGVVLLATWVPTRRAVAVEPRQALWGE